MISLYLDFSKFSKTLIETWMLNNQRHREDGPALIRSDGTEIWFKHDRKHRVDGPAQILSRIDDNNSKYFSESWWYKGVLYYTPEHPFNEFKIKNNLRDGSLSNEEIKTLFLLYYGDV